MQKEKEEEEQARSSSKYPGDQFLEDQLGAELQAAPSDALGRCVSGKHVSRGGVERKTAKRVDAVYAGRRVIDTQAERYPEPLMVKNVERFRLELDGEAFIDSRVFEHCHVGCADRLASFRVPANSEERGAEKLCGSDVVDNPVRLAHGDRIPGVQADEAAVARGCIHALANRVEGGAGTVEDRATGVQK